MADTAILCYMASAALTVSLMKCWCKCSTLVSSVMLASRSHLCSSQHRQTRPEDQKATKRAFQHHSKSLL